MESEPLSSAPASGSKRKRRDLIDHFSDVNPDDDDTLSPKRSRSVAPPADTDVSDATTPARQRGLRRKKGVSNLSTLSLRHEAEQQRQTPASRGSKFLEGSLTDRPSEKPPSTFTRIISTDAGDLALVDHLMAEYHYGTSPSEEHARAAVEAEKATMAQRVAELDAQNKDESSALFRFGHKLATNFHPVTLWNRLWTETKDELMLRNIEEAERRQRQKEEAEAKYAELKQAGQLAFARVRHEHDADPSGRDSGVVMEDIVSAHRHSRLPSYASQSARPGDDEASQSESEAPETATKPTKIKTLKSRLHFKRPSLTNLKFDLKRTRSDLNLAGSARRESSSSVSPVKAEPDAFTLRASHSKLNLKKQHRLSKRVSDLEVRLQSARKDLDVALAHASPMPKLGSKYERFTPTSTLKRPKFVPGGLPSLPSERLLDPVAMGFGEPMEMEGLGAGEEQMLRELEEQTVPGSDGNEEQALPGSEAQALPEIEEKSQKAFDLAEQHEPYMDQDTIKASHAKPYPPRASSLFGSDNNNNTDLDPTSSMDELAKLDDNKHVSTTQTIPADSNDSVAADGASPDGHGQLDTKLKTLDANVKLTKKQSRAKKRKSAGVDDGVYKPSRGDDEDADEWEPTKSTSKKRKSTGSAGSPSDQRVGGGSGKKASKSKKKAGKKGGAPAAEGHDDGEEAAAPTQRPNGNENGVDDAAADSVRTSLDSITRSLEPLYEEEEEAASATGTAPLVPPSKPSTKIAAGHARRASRSASPAKRADSLRPGAEETIMTRAAQAAQKHPGRLRRPTMTPGKDEYEWPEDVF